MANEFSSENKKKFEEILTRYPTKQAALLPTIWLVQDQFGWVPEEAMEYIAGLLEISPVHVYSVVTFYTMFRRKPMGKYHIQMCRTLSCALCGGETLLEHVQKKLGIGENEVSPDGKFSLCTVECLASCGTGPVMMVNEKYYESLNAQKVDELLASLE